jgi:hypothetical protein
MNSHNAFEKIYGHFYWTCGTQVDARGQNLIVILREKKRIVKTNSL